MRAAVPGLIVALLEGCGPAPPRALPACVVPGAQPMLRAELFFGRRPHVSDADWDRFMAEVVVPTFPAGATALDAAGLWQPAPGAAPESEPSTMLILVVPDATDAAARLQSVADAYKRRFNQRSVLILTQSECAAF